jgi:nitroreductase
MSVYDLIRSRRSIRQFEPRLIERKSLEKIVEAARVAPSAANLQPLEFIAIDDEGMKKAVFACLKWAAYIAPQGNPEPGHEPQAYVVTLVNSQIREKGYEYDVGAAMENMILAALGERIGSCWLISVDKPRVMELLRIPGHYKIDCVLALGYPAETPLVEDMKDSCRYWKDPGGQLHVPKRRLDAVIHFNKF